MADQKISQMPSAQTLTGAELAPLVQDGVNVKATTTVLVSETIQVDPSGFRSDLGLGTMSTQDSDNVSITGGSVAASAITGTLGATHGGTAQNTYVLGDTLYASGTNTLAKLPGNTTTTNKFLVQTGTGTLSAAPNWHVIVPSDINTQYGAFQNNATLTNTTPGSGIPMRFNTTDISNGVSMGTDLSGNKTEITIAVAGVYNFAFSAQLNKNGGGGAAIDVYIWMRLNGVDIPDSNTRITLQGANLFTVAAWNFFFQAAANDKFQLMWGSSSPNAEITYLGTPTIGPEIPAVILTVNQVS